MKTFTKTVATLMTITLPIIIGITMNLAIAQTPPPPNGGNTPTEGGNTPVGGGAPIAGGLGILLALGAAYGGRKVYDFTQGRTNGK